MASRIKGITVEINGDTTKLSKALSGVNGDIKNTQSKLKDVEKLLKLDPTNTELLSQKQRLLATAIGDTQSKLETLKTASEQFGSLISPQQYDALQREIAETEQNLQGLQREAESSRMALIRIGEAGETLEKVGDKISGAGEKLLPLTAGITALGTAAVTTTANFDSSMSKVSAISGATGDDLDQFRKKAREMGAETKYSASEAADDDSAHFSDVLAAASSNANTNVSLLGESFKYCAPLAGAMGASSEDLALALGLMANSGIKGSQAGNSLKNALVNLVKPTDAQAAAMENLGLIMTETRTIFDDKAIQKAQENVEKQTISLQKAQISYNSAVEKYGENSANAQKALLNLETAEKNLTTAQDALTTAQTGTVKTIRTGQNAFTDESGNMKSLKEIMDVLRESMGAVNVELVDSDGNLKEYDNIIDELSQTEEGLTQAEQHLIIRS